MYFYIHGGLRSINKKGKMSGSAISVGNVKGQVTGLDNNLTYVNVRTGGKSRWANNNRASKAYIRHSRRRVWLEPHVAIFV